MIGGGCFFLLGFGGGRFFEDFAGVVDEAGGEFLFVAVVVEFEEAGHDFFAGVGADGVATAVVFGEEFEVIEAVVQGDV